MTITGHCLQHCAHCGAPVGCDSGGAFFVRERCGDIGPLCETCARGEAEWYGNTVEVAFDRLDAAVHDLIVVAGRPLVDWAIRAGAYVQRRFGHRGGGEP